MTQSIYPIQACAFMQIKELVPNLSPPTKSIQQTQAQQHLHETWDFPAPCSRRGLSFSSALQTMDHIVEQLGFLPKEQSFSNIYLQWRAWGRACLLMCPCEGQRQLRVVGSLHHVGPTCCSHHGATPPCIPCHNGLYSLKL